MARHPCISEPGSITTTVDVLPQHHQVVGIVTLPFSRIPRGTFLMGTPVGEPGRCPGYWSGDEAQHEVVLTADFWMARTVVTQAQWRGVMGFDPHADPGRGSPKGPDGRWRVDYPGDVGPDKPVVGVNRAEALEFCRKLASATGRTVRLPSEAEWEYACRAGATTPFHFGADASLLGEYAVYGREYGHNERVASRRPNAWGLYDMHGNVWEWVLDCYAPYPTGRQVDPRGPDAPADPRWPRVMRGGCSVNAAENLRSGSRHCIEEDFRNSVVGFRVCMEA